MNLRRNRQQTDQPTTVSSPSFSTDMKTVESGTPQGKKTTNPTTESQGTDGIWKPLRSARKAAAAAMQKRSVTQSNSIVANGSAFIIDNDQLELLDNTVGSTTATTTAVGAAVGAGTAVPPKEAPLLAAVSSASDTNSPAAANSSIPPPRESFVKPNLSQFIPAYSDNFTFAPLPDFVPISSCDDLVVDPPDFDSPSDLKMSHNFSKLISNAKKVDQVRAAQAKRTSRPTPVPPPSIDTLKMTAAQDIMEQQDGNYLTVEEAQKRLIEQLKQGLNFLSKENKELTKQRNGLEDELKISKERMAMKQKEVEERNLKLAVLEHHFRILNNHSLNDPLQESEEEGLVDGVKHRHENGEGSVSIPSENGPLVEETIITDRPVSVALPVAPTSSSSIVQIDKGYYMQLEATVKKEQARHVKMQKINEDLAMKYALLERDTQNELLDMAEKLKQQETMFQEQMSRQERTIERLELSLRKSRDLLFKKGKSHRRRATVSALPTEADVLMDQEQLEKDQDETSISIATLNSSPTDNEQEHKDQEQQSGHILEREDVKEAIAVAVRQALEEREKEHRTLMDVLSKQLEVKDNHINSLETKMFSMLKTKNESRRVSTPQRAVPQDVMIRGMAVTNELLDSSMRKLENMMLQMNRQNGDSGKIMTDEMDQIRRVATKMVLLQEEMKISLKTIDQKIQNGLELVKHNLDEESNHDDPNEDKDKVNSDKNERMLPEDMMKNLTQSLQETEGYIKDEFVKLKNYLEAIEFDLAAKNDTIEALELACAEHVENYRALQKEFEAIKSSSEM